MPLGSTGLKVYPYKGVFLLLIRGIVVESGGIVGIGKIGGTGGIAGIGGKS